MQFDRNIPLAYPIDSKQYSLVAMRYISYLIHSLSHTEIESSHPRFLNIAKTRRLPLNILSSTVPSINLVPLKVTLADRDGCLHDDLSRTSSVVLYVQQQMDPTACQNLNLNL
jgi:hypothetical protein